MKKILFVIACVCMVLGLVSCKKSKSSEKATEKTVLKYLPGTWKISQVVDEDGIKEDFKGNIVLTFGKQESESDSGSDHTSSLWGYFKYKENGQTVIEHGTWNIEPSSEDKGVFFYCRNGKSMVIIGADAIYYITRISASSMRWEIGDDVSGYILSRVD